MKKALRIATVIMLCAVSSVALTGCNADASQVSQVLSAVGTAMQAIGSLFGSASSIDNSAGTVASDTTFTSRSDLLPSSEQSGDRGGKRITAASDNPDSEMTASSKSEARRFQKSNSSASSAKTRTSTSKTSADALKTVSESRDARVKGISQRYGVPLCDSLDGDIGMGDSVTKAVWDEKQLAQVEAILSSLPASFRQCTKSITLVGSIRNSQGFGAYGLCIQSKQIIYLCTTRKENTLVHEMTHAWTNSPGGREAIRLFHKTFWTSDGSRPKSNPVNSNGSINSEEDLAESVGEYTTNGARMKISNPERYAFVKDHVMGGKEF